jgi:CO/xanthine dehydrogenase FAD-binding subunit
VYAFKYQRADSVGAAKAALSADDSAKVLSGGMTLLPSMKLIRFNLSTTSKNFHLSLQETLP